MTNELKQEYTLKITQANKSQITVLTFEIALSYMKDAKEKYEADNMEEYKKSLRQAQNCIAQLMESLNFEYEISYHLMQLYTYANRELILATVKKDASYIEPAVKVMQALYESFVEVSKQDTSSPVMENTQTVYAGLTYGRNTLNENLNDAGASRGFCV